MESTDFENDEILDCFIKRLTKFHSLSVAVNKSNIATLSFLKAIKNIESTHKCSNDGVVMKKLQKLIFDIFHNSI